MDWAFGPARGRSLASDLVLSALGGITPAEAIDGGHAPHEVWLAICDAMDCPASWQNLHRIKPDERGDLASL